MTVTSCNWFLSEVSAVLVLLLTWFTPRRRIRLTLLLGPAIIPFVFWAYQYLTEPVSDLWGTKRWTTTCVLAIGQSYLVAVPIGIISLFIRSHFDWHSHKLKASLIFIILSLLYVISYVVLSFFGRYQPSATDLRGVMAYSWAPLGFYDPDYAWSESIYAEEHPKEKTGGWSTVMVLTFFPLWIVDIRFIHLGGRNPVGPRGE